MSSVIKDNFVSAVIYTCARSTYFCEFHAQQNGINRLRKWSESMIIYTSNINSTINCINICNVSKDNDNVYTFMTFVIEWNLQISCNCKILLEFMESGKIEV